MYRSSRFIVLTFIMMSFIFFVCNAVAQDLGTWNAVAPLPVGRDEFGAATLNGEIYAVGGLFPGHVSSNSVDKYNPGTNSWTTATSMLAIRNQHDVAELGGYIYAVGGWGTPYGSGPILNSVERYNPATDSWSYVSPMNIARTRHAVATVDGILYAVGGWSGNWSDDWISNPAPYTLNSVEAYNPATDTWTLIPPMTTGRFIHAAVGLNGKLYVIGGWNGIILGSVEVYDPATNQWSAAAPLPTPRNCIVAKAVNGKIYVTGGESATIQRSKIVEEYDPATNTWRRVRDMITGRSIHAASTHTGKMYAMGGWTNSGFTDAVEEYTAPGNIAPIAVNDTYITDEDTVLSVAAPGVLSNDIDFEDDMLTSVKLMDPSHGMVTLNADGSFTYAPASDYYGSDSFIYKINDGHADSDIGVVTITVNAVNDAPAATADNYSTNEDISLTVAAPGVLSNDADVEGDTLTSMKVNEPSYGTLTLNTDGSFTYVPDTNYNGSDNFTYRANDGLLDSNVATVTITVNAVNDAPIASNLNIMPQLPESGDSLNASYTYYDEEGNPEAGTQIMWYKNGSHQGMYDSLLIIPSGATLSGEVWYFTLTPSDGLNAGETLQSHSVTIGVTAEIQSMMLAEGNTIESTQIGNIDPEQAPIEYTYDNTQVQSLTFGLNWGGSSLVLSVYDPTGQLKAETDTDVQPPAIATIQNAMVGIWKYTVTPIIVPFSGYPYVVMVGRLNHPPVVADDMVTTDEDSAVTVNVLSNDSDADGNTLIVIKVVDVSHGSLTQNADGSFTYEPNANYNGSDSFTYKVNDGELDSNIATVTITVNAVNNAPTADSQSVTTGEDIAKAITLTASDVDGDSLTYSIVIPPAHGVLNGILPDVTYTPDADYNGSDSFTYKVNDGYIDSNVATVDITISPINDAPLAINDDYSVNEDMSLMITAPGVLGNDSDIDGDNLTAVKISDPSHGTLTLNADGSFTYIPSANYEGADSFTYRAKDPSNAESNVAIVLITVNSVNDSPVITSTPVTEATEDVLYSYHVEATDPDIGDTLTYSLSVSPSGMTIDSASGMIQWTPTNTQVGDNNVTLAVTDITGASNSQSFTIAVSAITNNSPTVDPITSGFDPVSVNTNVNTSASFSDPDENDTHTASWNWGDASSTEGVIDSGTVSGEHVYTTAGVYTITLTVTDNHGATGISTHQYTVVYDPDGGFVTGGGWINSPIGAYAANSTLTGRANFGFVSKYKKGATVPTGNTEFSFKVASLNFYSDIYDWLVVAGPKAQYKGVGTINGDGEYGFMLTATDGEINGGGGVDKFRIKIWDKATESIVYDNQMDAPDDAEPTTAIGGGSIVIHKDKDKDPEAAPQVLPNATCLLAAYPNPFNPEVWIPYQLGSESAVFIRIYDVSGRLVRTLDLGHRPAGFYISKDKAVYWDGTNEAGEHSASGIYFYNIQAGVYSATRKMIIVR